MTRKATKRKTRAWPAALRARLSEADAAASRGGNRAHARSVLELGALAVAPNSGVVAFPSGATVVVYDPGDDAPATTLRAPPPGAPGVVEARAGRDAPLPPDAERGSQPFACVALSSPDGAFLAAGETAARPAVFVWRVDTREPLAALRGHRHGVRHLAFHPTRPERLVTLGDRADGHVCVWDWRAGMALARAFAPRERLCSVAFSLARDPTPSVVVAGDAHLALWSVRDAPCGGAKSGVNAPAALARAPAAVGGHARSEWVAVAAGMDSETDDAYAFSAAGVLSLLRDGATVERWVDARIERGACAAASARLIAVGGGKGVVRLFAATTLAYEGTLPRPAAMDAAKSADAAKDPSSVRFPAATACAFGATGNVLAVAYADGSVVVWDVAAAAAATPTRSFAATTAARALDGRALADGAEDVITRVWRADPRAAEIEARRKEQRDTLACLRAEIPDEERGETRATDPDSDLAKRSSDTGSVASSAPSLPAWDLPAWADVAKPKPSATNGDDADAPKSSPSRAAAGAWLTRAAGYEIHGVGRGVRSSGDGARRHLGAVDAADISVELVPGPSRFDGTAANVDEDDAALYYADSEPGGEATDAFGAITVSASGLALALAKVDEEGSGKDAAGAETPEPSVIPEPSASPVVSRRADADADADDDDDLATAPRALRFEDEDDPRERASKIARVSDVSLTFAAESPGAAAERASFERRRSLRRSALFSPRASPSSSPSPPKSPPSPSAARAEIRAAIEAAEREDTARKEAAAIAMTFDARRASLPRLRTLRAESADDASGSSGADFGAPNVRRNPMFSPSPEETWVPESAWLPLPPSPPEEAEEIETDAVEGGTDRGTDRAAAADGDLEAEANGSAPDVSASVSAPPTSSQVWSAIVGRRDAVDPDAIDANAERETTTTPTCGGGAAERSVDASKEVSPGRTKTPEPVAANDVDDSAMKRRGDAPATPTPRSVTSATANAPPRRRRNRARRALAAIAERARLAVLRPTSARGGVRRPQTTTDDARVERNAGLAERDAGLAERDAGLAVLPDDTVEADSASDSASDSAPDSTSEPEPRGAPILAVVSIDAEKENVDPETCPKAAAIAAVDALDAAVHAAVAARAAVAAAVDGGETMRDVDAKLRSLAALLARVSRDDDEADERRASADADAQTDGGGGIVAVEPVNIASKPSETTRDEESPKIADMETPEEKAAEARFSEETAREGVRQGATEGAIRDAVEEARPDAVEEARGDVSEDGPARGAESTEPLAARVESFATDEDERTELCFPPPTTRVCRWRSMHGSTFGFDSPERAPKAKAETGAVAVDAEDGWSSENERSLARVMERCLATYSERLIAAVRESQSRSVHVEAEAAKTLGASAAGLG